MSELICVDAQYNEVECDSPEAAFQVSKADAKAKRKAMGLPAVAETEAPELSEADLADAQAQADATAKAEAEAKSVKQSPANKAVSGPAENK